MKFTAKLVCCSALVIGALGSAISSVSKNKVASILNPKDGARTRHSPSVLRDTYRKQTENPECAKKSDIEMSDEDLYKINIQSINEMNNKYAKILKSGNGLDEKWEEFNIKKKAEVLAARLRFRHRRDFKKGKLDGITYKMKPCLWRTNFPPRFEKLTLESIDGEEYLFSTSEANPVLCGYLIDLLFDKRGEKYVISLKLDDKRNHLYSLYGRWDHDRNLKTWRKAYRHLKITKMPYSEFEETFNYGKELTRYMKYLELKKQRGGRGDFKGGYKWKKND